MADPPQVLVIAGPNGAGKTTFASELVPAEMEFVNADVVAQELAGEGIEHTEVRAGRIVLARMDEIEASRASFAVETALASRSLAPRLQRLQASGYIVRVYYVWLPDAETAVNRVADRVRRGGHSIPEDVIRRRYERGLQNFLRTYRALADEWRVYANVSRGTPEIIASGSHEVVGVVDRADLWSSIMKSSETVRETGATYAYTPARNDDAVSRAFRRGVRKALLEHKRDGDPMVEWRDGKVVWVPAEEIVIPDEEDT